jgi:HDOD domain
MNASSVVYLKTATRTVDDTGEQRVLQELGAALRRVPPKPPGIAACTGYLQQEAVRLASWSAGIRSLQHLRDSLFCAPGREQEMAGLWRESLACACYARVLAVETQSNASLLTVAGLLQRAVDLVALRALAAAELASGQRLNGPVMQELAAARDEDLESRVISHWALSLPLGALLRGWRIDQPHSTRPIDVRVLMLAQALAAERVREAVTPPSLVESAAADLELPLSLVEKGRAASADIAALLQLLSA